MMKPDATLHMKLPVQLKKQAVRAADKADLSLTQWVKLAMREKLNG